MFDGPTTGALRLLREKYEFETGGYQTGGDQDGMKWVDQGYAFSLKKVAVQH